MFDFLVRASKSEGTIAGEASLAAARAKILQCGLKLLVCKTAIKVQWTGKRKVIRVAPYPRAHSNALHDLAHWAVCTSEQRRRLPDFGLGPSPDSSLYLDKIPRRVSNPEAASEEKRASMLGILMELELSMNSQFTWWEHSWEEYDKDAEPIAIWLKTSGLIKTDGSVVWARVAKGVAR